MELSGSSVSFIVPTSANLIKLKFSINGQCTTILPTDFYNITALIDGNVSSSKFIEGQSAGIIDTVIMNVKKVYRKLRINSKSELFSIMRIIR